MPGSLCMTLKVLQHKYLFIVQINLRWFCIPLTHSLPKREKKLFGVICVILVLRPSVCYTFFFLLLFLKVLLTFYYLICDSEGALYNSSGCCRVIAVADDLVQKKKIGFPLLEIFYSVWEQILFWNKKLPYIAITICDNFNEPGI